MPVRNLITSCNRYDNFRVLYISVEAFVNKLSQRFSVII